MQKNKNFSLLSICSILIIVLVLQFIAINNFSLWIDEGTTAYFASLSNFSGLVSKLLRWNGSEAQMPGYIVYIWSWAKIFGHSELALRYSNLPFLMWFYFTLIISSLSRRNKLIIIFLVVLNPFIWYNLNEARNTIIIFSLSFIILINLYDYFNNGFHISKINLIVVAFITGILFNLLFFFYAIVLLVLFIAFGIREKLSLKDFLSKVKYQIIALVSFSTVILAYYLFTLSHGAGGMHQRPGITNLANTFYEFAGFIGLGPSRNEARGNININVFLNYKNTLFPFILLLLAFVLESFIFLRKIKKLNILYNNYFLAFIVTLVFFYLASLYEHFRFWARHLAFLYPVFILYIATIIDSILLVDYKKVFLFTVIGLLIFWVYSDMQIRFNPKYQKDNYRFAVNKTLEMDKNHDLDVVWAGDEMTASYYGLIFKNFVKPVTWPNKLKVYTPGELLEGGNISGNKIIIVLFKKYDMFDPRHYLRNYIEKHNYLKTYDAQDFLIYEQKH